MTKIRLDPKDRRAELLQIALQVAEKNPQYTFRDVAEAGGVTVPLVIHYFGTKPQLQRHVMRAAVKQEIVPVVAHGLLTGDIYARKASPELREKVSTYLVERAAH